MGRTIENETLEGVYFKIPKNGNQSYGEITCSIKSIIPLYKVEAQEWEAPGDQRNASLTIEPSAGKYPLIWTFGNTNEIKMHKYDSETGEPVLGAVFSIELLNHSEVPAEFAEIGFAKNSEGKIIRTETTGETGEFFVTPTLKPSDTEYKLKITETDVLDEKYFLGKDVEFDISFKIEADGKVSVTAPAEESTLVTPTYQNEDGKIIIYWPNKKKGENPSLEIYKHNQENKEETVEGAVFNIEITQKRDSVEIPNITNELGDKYGDRLTISRDNFDVTCTMENLKTDENGKLSIVDTLFDSEYDITIKEIRVDNPRFTLDGKQPEYNLSIKVENGNITKISDSESDGLGITFDQGSGIGIISWPNKAAANVKLELEKHESGNESIKITGAKFDISMIQGPEGYVFNNGNDPKAVTTGTDGRSILAENLITGSYVFIIQETATAGGYVIPNNNIAELSFDVTGSTIENMNIKGMTSDVLTTSKPDATVGYDSANQVIALKWGNPAVKDSKLTIHKISGKDYTNLPNINFDITVRDPKNQALVNIGAQPTDTNGIISRTFKFRDAGIYTFTISEDALTLPAGLLLPDGNRQGRYTLRFTLEVNDIGEVIGGPNITEGDSNNINVLPQSNQNGELEILVSVTNPSYTPPGDGNIEGYVWEDTRTGKINNYDGLFDNNISRLGEGEKGINGVKVTLYRQDGSIRTELRSTTTGPKNGIDGFYAFNVTLSDLNVNPTSYSSNGGTQYQTPGENVFFVVFEYNGLDYTTTKEDPTGTGDWTSKAIERR